MLSAYQSISRKPWTVGDAVERHAAAVARLTAPPPVPAPLPTRWRDISPAQLFTLAARAAEEREGLAFSLNLGDAVERELAAVPNRISYMARRLSRALKAADLAGLPFAFRIEEDTKDGPRLHLHGFLLTGEVDSERVKEALMRAGGKVPGRAASRQVMLRP